jgi:phenylalanyl-tRNA synthetase beta chain
VQPPSWRPDLTRAADLVEEVLRLEGYRTIPVTLPRAPAARGLTAGQRARRRITAAVADAGFGEVLLLPFIGRLGERLDLGMLQDDPRRRLVQVANPLSDDEAYLRTTLLPGLMDAAVRNVNRGNPDVALFEIGTVFFAKEQPESITIPPVDRRPTPDELLAIDALLPEQPTHIGAVLTGLRVAAGPLQAARAADWADTIALAHVIAAAAGTRLEVTAAEYAPWHPGRCAALSVTTAPGSRVVGHAGELHPRLVADAELPPRACALELDLGALISAAKPPPVLPPLSPYPPADRDVALLVAAGVSAADVESALRAGAGADLEGLRLFDDFTTRDGQRSLAYRLRWRAGRTLTADEVNALRDAAVAEAAARTGTRQRA